MIRLPFSALILMGFSLGLISCEQEISNDAEWTRAVSYPTGLAIHPSSNVLTVVSSNYDLKYESGLLLVANLDEVSEQLDQVLVAEGPLGAVQEPYFDSVTIPSFGHRPVFSANGEHVFIATRRDNLISEVEFLSSNDQPFQLHCGDQNNADAVPNCGQDAYSVQMSGNDPYDIVLYEENESVVSGVVSLISHDEVIFFESDSTEPAATRNQVAGTLSLGINVLGARSMIYRPPTATVPGTIFAAVETFGYFSSTPFIDLAYFEPSRGSQAVVHMESLTGIAGATSARGLTLSPDGDAIFVLLREPDAVLRMNLVETDGRLSVQTSQMTSTCKNPTAMAAFQLPDTTQGGQRDYLMITCFSDDTISIYDAISLSQIDVLRYFGRGPFDVAINSHVSPPEAYVSFFLDNSIGVFSLQNESGGAHLQARGRIGLPSIKPEDGR
jgi:hypothetical protein